MNFYVGMDIGGTHARMQVAGHCGQILGTFTETGCTINVNGYEESRRRYRKLVLDSLVQLHLLAGNCLEICVAASGVDSPRQAEQCREIFCEMGFKDEIVTIINDCEVFLLKSKVPSLVLVCGTGSIAVGRTAEGEFVRCGGWGHILSDEGSAYYMGLSVLRAVGNHLDGRIPCPELWRLFSMQSELCSMLELNTYVAANIADKPAVARFAPLIDKAVECGDTVSEEIVDDCVQRLFALVRDTYYKICKIPATAPVPILLWGSVL